MAEQTVQTSSDEAQVRAGIVAALSEHGVTVVSNEPGGLVIDTGSVGKAFLTGGFRATSKMPVRIQVTIAPSEGGSTVVIDAGSHGTGSGFASGGLIGMSKTKKAAQAWLQQVVEAIPGREQGVAGTGGFTT